MVRAYSNIILFVLSISLILFVPPLYSRDTTEIQVDTTKIQQDTTHLELKLYLEETPFGIETGICGTPLHSAVRVRVEDASGNPVPGIEVAFSLIGSPDQSTGTGLSQPIAVTDSTGRAQTRLNLGSKPGAYSVSCRISEGFPDNEVIFKAKAKRKNWVYMLIIGLFGGLGLFVFGMHTMSEGLQQSAGERLRSILGNVTRNRIVGTGIGTLVTTIIQSSSATSVMLVSFVNAKLLQFRQTIPVLLGAAIGTTITAQMIAFKITEYSLLLVAAGFFLQAFTKKEQLKSVEELNPDNDSVQQ